MWGGGHVRKTVWDQLLKGLECHAKNYGPNPPGNEKLAGLLAEECLDQTNIRNKTLKKT